MDLHGRSFLTLLDYSPEEIRFLLDLSHQVKREKRARTFPMRLKHRNVVAYWRRWRALLAAFVAGEETQAAVVASLRGWINHARYGDTWGLRKAVARQAVF